MMIQFSNPIHIEIPLIQFLIDITKGETSIIVFEKHIYIDRPPQVVFDYMSDPANDAQWRAGSRSAEWASNDPIGVGSLMRSEDHAMGRKIETFSKITSWDPPLQYGFKSLSKSFPAEFSFNLEAEGDGTQLTARGQIEFKGLFKFLELFSSKGIRTRAEEDFITLKQVLERL
jgi:carbon monoxide dehydrogenase subunit G